MIAEETDHGPGSGKNGLRLADLLWLRRLPIASAVNRIVNQRIDFVGTMFGFIDAVGIEQNRPAIAIVAADQ